MKQAILSQFPWPWLPSLGLIIFLALFIFLVLREYRREAQTTNETLARLPLEELPHFVSKEVKTNE